VIDLRSDNACHPTAAMRRAMSSAAVGDDAVGEDPTVCALEERVADWLGHPAAVFMPSGTLCNIVAFEIYRGEAGGGKVLAESSSHPTYSGYCGPRFGRPELRTIEGEGGIIKAAALTPSVTDGACVLSLENTHNRGGGRVWPLGTLEETAQASHRIGVQVHLDGARLPNAIAATGLSAREYCAAVDSAFIDLSKGLGCPSGAVMVGGEEFIAEARQLKVLFGGGMHKTGMLAAAGLFALDSHMGRLQEDHERARLLAGGLSEMGYEQVHTPVETNLVYFRPGATGWAADALVDVLKMNGVMTKTTGPNLIRAVTHLDITDGCVRQALAVLSRLAKGGPRGAETGSGGTRAEIEAKAPGSMARGGTSGAVRWR
jgi:threonine aldolase